MESTDDFLSNEYLHDYATTIFDVFDDSPGESVTHFAFCVIKRKAQLLSGGNTPENVCKSL